MPNRISRMLKEMKKIVSGGGGDAMKLLNMHLVALGEGYSLEEIERLKRIAIARGFFWGVFHSVLTILIISMFLGWPW